MDLMCATMRAVKLEMSVAELPTIPNVVPGSK